MQCIDPSRYRKDGYFKTSIPPCGTCLPCRMNDRQTWASRLVCERKAYTHAQFITLTYSDEFLPTSVPDAKLSFQQFIKRYRKNTGHQPRYFACMEYGTRFQRLHWHAIFFGETTHYERRRKNGHSIVVDPKIEDNWQNGSTYVKDCDSSTQGINISQYVAGYILKDAWKNSGTKGPPEMGLQSRKPYIGKPATKSILELLTTKPGAKRCSALGTVPDKIKFAGRYYKLYSRIRKDLAEALQYPYLSVPWNDGTIINLDGYAIINETPRAPFTIHEAQANAKRLSNKISTLRKRNTTAQTG